MREGASSAAIFLSVLLSACSPQAETTFGALPQRGYLWQREWRPAVIESLIESRKRLDGIVVLGAEVEWNGVDADVRRASIDWTAVAQSGVRCGIGLRVAPFAGPFFSDDSRIRAIAATAQTLLADAAAAGVQVSELQIDFDCAQRNLVGYRRWIETLKPLVRPVRLVITALPSWLEEDELLPLLRAADGYVLQVHSVPLAAERAGTLCDPAAARRWVAKAARLGLPFSVALPTYRCVAGYDEAGKQRGVVMDSVQAAWPHGTRAVEFSADANQLAQLVQEWTNRRPAQLQELLWYRVPVATDARNWRWPTLAAVVAGRAPQRQVDVAQEGENPIDLSIANTGEADERRAIGVRVTWTEGTLLAAEALPGWQVQSAAQQAQFMSDAPLRVAPGDRAQIGWLRFEKPIKVNAVLQ